MSPRTSGLFHFVMIKPSHYDDDGYVIQWVRSAMPSNSLATIYGLADDCRQRQVLGPDVDLRLHAFDETNTRIVPERIARMVRRGGGSGLIGLVGVQSNQFPRALDLARRFRAAGLPVCIGGFHVSGVLSMLKHPTPELQGALDLGVSLFAGEAEGRLERVLRDAQAGQLRPIYNFIDDLPQLAETPLPFLPAARIERTVTAHTSFDAGRGCPFQCSFCTIINVQGRKSRHRSPDDVERIVRANIAQGINRFFITDDNFARNRDWEAIFDRLIRLRVVDGLNMRFTIQVDTLCHRLPNFITKARRAGVSQVFIGLENINPDNLASAKKRQNRIGEYRRMLQAWRAARVMTYAGYILGFPTDTPERIVRDIEIVKRELPVDLLEFGFLTPLPGSEDHKTLHARGVAMDPDLNRYDLAHPTTAHPLMSKQDWARAYRLAWDTYFTDAHVETLLRRARINGMSIGRLLGYLTWYRSIITLEGVHPLEGGHWRLKFRRDRRPGLPVENPLVFYPRYAWSQMVKLVRSELIRRRWQRICDRVIATPLAAGYRDPALEPVEDEDLTNLDIFSVTAGGAAEKEKIIAERRRAAR